MLDKSAKQGQIIRALIMFGVCLTGAAYLRSCAQEHRRENDHLDIAFNVSHQGDRIVFTAKGQGGRDLYILDLKSKRVTPVGRTPAYEGDPSFSPDDKSILYVAGVPGDRADHIFVRALDGSAPRQITADDYNDSAPAFSPDGSRIVFVRHHEYRWGGLASSWGGDTEVYLVNADGTQQRRLTNLGSVVNPLFTPDAKAVIFMGWTEPTPPQQHAVATDIYLMPINEGQSPRKLRIITGYTAAYCSLSPDGKRMVLSSHRGPIRLINMDGSGLSPIGPTDLRGLKTVFAPDGKHLFFLSARGEDFRSEGWVGLGVWRMDIDGKNLQRIADSSLFDSPLFWKPSESTSPSEGLHSHLQCVDRMRYHIEYYLRTTKASPD